MRTASLAWRRAFPSALSLLAASLPGLFAPGLRAQPAAKPYVVLVWIDGYRADYTDRYKAKNFAALRDAGASAAMIPSFPSITFPNHNAIVTGEYPEHHGIVGNTFFDVERNQEYSVISMISPFENVNVYPFIAKILRLKLPEKLDGSEAVLDPIYLP